MFPKTNQTKISYLFLRQIFTMQLLDGKKIAAAIKAEIAEEVKQLKSRGKKIPHLAAILVGDDGASQTYVASKVKSCQDVGFKSTLVKLKRDITENELITQINLLNNDDSVDGFIVGGTGKRRRWISSDECWQNDLEFTRLYSGDAKGHFRNPEKI